MSIRKKLNLGFITLIFLILLTSTITLFQFNTIQAHVEEAVDQRIVQIQLAEEIQTALASHGLYLRSYILNKDSASEEALQNHDTILKDKLDELSSIVRSDLTKGILKEMTALHSELQLNTTNALKAYKENDIDLTLKYVNEDVTNTDNDMLLLSKELMVYQNEKLSEISHQSKSTVEQAIVIAIVAGGISILIGIYLMIYVRKSIVTPLRNVINSADIIAQGDLTGQNVAFKSNDEIGQLANAVNTLKQSLHTLIHNVQQNTIQLSAASQELSASTQEITASSSEVAYRVQETYEQLATSATASSESAQAMDETSSGVQRIAEATQTLHQNAVDMT
ncbi:MAG: methyl-accepting chemotaxis protein, partial [Lysinibacillus sp.]